MGGFSKSNFLFQSWPTHAHGDPQASIFVKILKFFFLDPILPLDLSSKFAMEKRGSSPLVLGAPENLLPSTNLICHGGFTDEASDTMVCRAVFLRIHLGSLI